MYMQVTLRLQIGSWPFGLFLHVIKRAKQDSRVSVARARQCQLPCGA